jgi:hypothetical protein
MARKIKYFVQIMHPVPRPAWRTIKTLLTREAAEQWEVLYRADVEVRQTLVYPVRIVDGAKDFDLTRDLA